MSIGSAIHEIRKARGLTMKDLSMMVDVTPSLISQIEHDKANPSINTLVAIAHSLNVDVAEFFRKEDAEASEDSPVVRVGERFLVGNTSKWVQYFLTSRNLDALSVSINTLHPGATSDDSPELNPPFQKGYEFGLVLSGKLRVDLSGRTYVLNPGDSISFAADQKHTLINVAGGDTEVLWVMVPEYEQRKIMDRPSICTNKI